MTANQQQLVDNVLKEVFDAKHSDLPGPLAAARKMWLESEKPVSERETAIKAADAAAYAAIDAAYNAEMARIKKEYPQ